MKPIDGLSMKSVEDLKKLSKQKLVEERKKQEKLYYTMRMKHELWEQKQTHLMKYIKRYIATLKTLELQATA